jgi:hypothetical protein
MVVPLGGIAYVREVLAWRDDFVGMGRAAAVGAGGQPRRRREPVP